MYKLQIENEKQKSRVSTIKKACNANIKTTAADARAHIVMEKECYQLIENELNSQELQNFFYEVNLKYKMCGPSTTQ